MDIEYIIIIALIILATALFFIFRKKPDTEISEEKDIAIKTPGPTVKEKPLTKKVVKEKPEITPEKTETVATPKKKPAKAKNLRPAGTNEEFERLLENLKIYRFYHITHIDNLERILFNGLYSYNMAKKKNLVQREIINSEDRNKRNRIEDPIAGKPLYDYAALYFNARNPFTLKLKKSFDGLVLLGFDRSVIYQKGNLYTDGEPEKHQTRFFDNIVDLKELNWECIFKTKHWTLIEDGKRIRNAEVLAKKKIEASLINTIYCFNEDNYKKAAALCEGRDIEIKQIEKFFE